MVSAWLGGDGPRRAWREEWIDSSRPRVGRGECDEVPPQMDTAGSRWECNWSEEAKRAVFGWARYSAGNNSRLSRFQRSGRVPPEAPFDRSHPHTGPWRVQRTRCPVTRANVNRAANLNGAAPSWAGKGDIP